MNSEQIESRMMTGGLNGIPPLAFVNFLRIYMISFNEFRWRDWTFIESLPVLNQREWEEIQGILPQEQINLIIALYQNPHQMLPSQILPSGRNTPTKFYMQYLGEVLNNQVNNGKTTSTPKPQGNQSVLELTRDQNN